MMDLRQVFGSVEAAASASGAAAAPTPSEGAEAVVVPGSPVAAAIGATGPPIVCIVLATDGVWDNWAYEDVTRFVMDSSCLNAISAGADGAERVAKAFMQRNAVYAKRNFGGQADNATGIVVYLALSPLN